MDQITHDVRTAQWAECFLSYDDDDTKLWLQMRYYSRPRILIAAPIRPTARNDDNPNTTVMKPEEWIDLLIENDVDYVLFHTADEQFAKEFAVVFGGKDNISNDTVYKVEGRRLVACSF
ncbi:hypothetical protein [Butyrivibrio sp. VCB2001]|uniref:hypothetical protein n=1 Tax=Butyrivibrio sp. VCB2001 TaxID=1280667 RepID=UPI00041A5D69|nr:hypothetical protein [Butyrivibrio sp. VCB2001]